MLPLDEKGWRQGQKVLGQLLEDSLDWHRRTGLQGTELGLADAVEMRYEGQNYEITVELPHPHPTSEQRCARLSRSATGTSTTSPSSDRSTSSLGA